jgi:hypothetical protein
LCWLMAAGVVVDQDATGQHRLTITLEGLAEDVRSEAEEIAAALQRAGVPIITEGERTATARWCDHLVAASDGDLLMRAGVPPQHLALYWQMLPEDVRDAGAWFVDVAAGLLFVRVPAAEAATVDGWVEQVRQPALALRGYAVVQAGGRQTPPLDKVGYRSAGDDVGEAIRRRWDPYSILVAS